MQEEIFEALRNPFVFLYISVLLTWCVVSGSHLGDTVELEFRAYRMHQYDIVAVPHGSRSWKVMYEAVSLDANALRRCLVVNWRDLVGKDLHSFLDFAVGGVLIVIPSDFNTMSPSDRSHFSDLEQVLLSVNTDMAVYFAHQSPELLSLLADVTAFSKRAPSAIQQLYNAVAGNTFQFSSSSAFSGSVQNVNAANIVGRLWASDRTAPSVVIVASYDSYGVVPSLSIGSDSNGSGVVALLELLAIFSRYYSNASTRPKYNMIFILSAGGKFNYQGSRQWIEDHVEKQMDENIEVVICLDTIGKDKNLLMHVSKMPSDESPVGKMFARLKASFHPNRTVGIVSKKINLNAESLAWEHERYSIRRLPAFTLSRLNSHSSAARTSLLDTPQQLDQTVLKANIKTIGEAILAHVFNLPKSRCSHEVDISTCCVLTNDSVESRRVAKWVEMYASRPRPLDGNNERLIADLKDCIARYTAGHVSIEPVSLVDVSLYGALEDVLTAHRVKPAVFELLLALLIAAYLSIVYLNTLSIQSFIENTIVKLKKL